MRGAGEDFVLFLFSTLSLCFFFFFGAPPSNQKKKKTPSTSPPPKKKKKLQPPHRWWWRAFLNGGGVAAYILAYSAFYFFTRLEISAFVPSLLYFGYMTCVSLAVFCLAGSVGLWACLWFVRSIYAAVKID